MKKHSLTKILGIICALLVIMSFIIPAGYYNNGEFVKDTVAPVGIFSIFSYPLYTIVNFSILGIVFLAIGAYYGILNKTKAYPRFVETVAKKMKGKEKVAIIVTTIFFALLSSMAGISIEIFIIVPLFAAILMSIGYNKLSSMLATVGAILVGNMASVYGYTVSGYASHLTGNVHSSLLIKIILLVISIIALLVVILKSNKKSKDKVEEIALYQKTTKKVNTVPFIVLFILTFVLITVGMIEWNTTYGIAFFDNIHNAIMSFKVGNVAIFSYILGDIPALGNWGHYQAILALLISAFIIAKVYKVKCKEILEGALEGMKEILPVAFIVVIVNVVAYYAVMSNQNGYNIYSTMINKAMPNNFAVVPFGIVTTIGSVLYNDFRYLLSFTYGAIINYKTNYTLIAMMTQTLHGLVQLIAPTSIMLVAGLTYFKIPYVDYLKKLWKLFLCLLVAIIILLIFV